MPNILTTTEAALRLGVTPRAVRRYCAEGLLRATRAGRDWLIAERDLQRFTPPPNGRPARR